MASNTLASPQGKAAAMPIPGIENRKDGWRPSPHDISATPGGTMFATTPGGTKLTWSRQQLMHLANSPLSRSPLHLPRIPGVTEEEGEDDGEESPKKVEVPKPSTQGTKAPLKDDEDVFEMDA